ncbi:hypothetical protein AALJ34_16990 [Paraclostridium bifermentans]|uniref:hypothetical protein n=1 Tax=Paraclostridium bifermentans TaxID=1490 RepID=UPI001C124D14|nr:hypothetical protein [Paraclostridium bifermentans]MBU5290003.1 hypothetical protein [Paraclostridium bifermentans]
MKFINAFKTYFSENTIEPTPTNLYSINDINYLRYKVITKDNYIEYMLSKIGAGRITVNNVIENWYKLSNGYNFVIAVGRYESLDFYNVEYFNTYVIGRK